jgi:hypothetical protein
MICSLPKLLIKYGHRRDSRLIAQISDMPGMIKMIWQNGNPNNKY